MEDEDIAPNRDMVQLIQSVWTDSRACTLYWNRVYWRDILSVPTGLAVPYLAQYPRLQFCELIYIQLIHQWANHRGSSRYLFSRLT